MLNNQKLKNAYRLTEGFFSSHRFLLSLVIVVACLLLSIPGVALGKSGVMRPVDLLAEDHFYGRSSFDDGNITVIRVTSDSPGNFYAGGGDPQTLSALIDALNSAPGGKPAVIGIAGGIEPDPESPEYDSFIKLLAQDNIVLGVVYGKDSHGTVGDGDCFETPMKLSSPDLISGLDEAGVRYGHLNVVTDRDGVARHYLWSGVSDKGDAVDSFAAVCCRLWYEKNGMRFRAPGCSRDGMFMLESFSGALSENMLEAESVLAPGFSGEETAGRIVLIGACDSLIEYQYVTNASTRNVTGNVGIQASAVADALNDKTVLELSLSVQLFILTLVLATICYVILTCPFTAAVLTGAAIVTLFMFASDHLRSFSGIAVHPLYIIVSVSFCLTVGLFLQLSKVNRNQMAETNILNRYLDTSVRNKILFGLKSGTQEIGAKRPMAILHADIKNFSSIIEELSAAESIEILNSYFSVADKCIHANGGVLDSFSGSSVTAFWDDEECGGDASLRACRAALDISNGIRSVDDSLFEKYRHEFSFSMGVHFGSAVVGDIGSENRKSFTVAGPAFEIAKNLKDMATRGSVYISHTVHEKLGNLADDALLPDRIEHSDRLDYEQVFLLNDLFDPSEKAAMQVAPSEPETAPAREYTLYVLGTRGSYHVSGKRFVEFGGQTTCYIVKTGDHAVVIDCGTGLYEAREILKDCTVIDVVISHVHYDHCIGLLDWSIFPREAQLTFYGNFRGWLGSRTLNEMFRPPFWPVDLVSGKMTQIPAWGKRLFLKDGISFVFYPAPHPNEAAIMSMNAGSKKICIMVDCEQSNVLPLDILRDSDLLIYDGMYDDSEYKSHIGWGHSTWQEGVRLAQKASIKHLMISHHSPKNNDSVLLEYERLAQGSFPNTTFARMGMTLKF